MTARQHVRGTPFGAAAMSLGLVLAFSDAPARAQSSDSQDVGATAGQALLLPTLPGSSIIDVSEAVGSTKTRPAFFLLPRFVPASTIWSKPYTDVLDQEYDKWLATKQTISNDYNLDLSIDFSFFPQWGTSGKPVYAAIYYPSATFRPFTDTPVGSGEIEVTTAHQTFFTTNDTNTQAAHLHLISFANDWTQDDFYWSTVAYTHTLPGSMNWLSFTVGQYNLFSFDPNEYAANAQTSFISYSFAQDATQTFPNAGFGGYASVKTPDGRFNFAGGVQGGTDLDGGVLTTNGFDHCRLVDWGNAQWTPTVSGLGDGIYSLLIYEQPFVPMVSHSSTGVSLSISQELTDRYGTFLRVNNATGPGIPIRTSYAGGAVWNNPIERNPADQAGLALGWDKTNHQAVGTTGVRDGEWVAELFYKATIFKGMNLTPDVQMFWNPGLTLNAGPVAVFTLRTTVSF